MFDSHEGQAGPGSEGGAGPAPTRRRPGGRFGSAATTGGGETTVNYPNLSFDFLLKSDRIPKSEDVVPLLEQMQIVEEVVRVLVKVKVKSLLSLDRPMDLKWTEASFYRKCPVKITIVGSQRQIQAFVNAMENEARYFFCLRDMVLTPKDETLKIGGMSAEGGGEPGGGPRPGGFGGGFGGGMGGGMEAMGGGEPAMGATGTGARTSDKPVFRDAQVIVRKDRDYTASLTFDFVDFNKKLEPLPAAPAAATP